MGTQYSPLFPTNKLVSTCMLDSLLVLELLWLFAPLPPCALFSRRDPNLAHTRTREILIQTLTSMRTWPQPKLDLVRCDRQCPDRDVKRAAILAALVTRSGIRTQHPTLPLPQTQDPDPNSNPNPDLNPCSDLSCTSTFASRLSK